MTSSLENYAQFMENLSTATLPEISRFVSLNVYFRDPFNEVVGIENMEKIFAEMFETMGGVRFDVLHGAMTDNTGLLYWRLTATLRGKPWTFEGMTKVEFNEEGLVIAHVDHWDAAREFYEHFPVIGWSLKTIRQRIAL